MSAELNFYETIGANSHPIVVRNPHPSEMPHAQVLHEHEGSVLPSQRSIQELLAKGKGVEQHGHDNIHVSAFAGDDMVADVSVKPVPGQQYAYQVDQLTTHADFRGQGIASQILQVAEKQAKERGAKSINVDVTPHAHNLFARLGYTQAPALASDTPEGHISLTKKLGTDGD